MTVGAQKPPPSVVIIPAKAQEPAPAQPALAGQVKAFPTNQIILQQGPISNSMANAGLALGITGIALTIAGPFLEGLTCIVGWFFGILGIIFGHIGASRGKQIGIGRAQGIIGLTLGYITLVLYIAAPIIIWFYVLPEYTGG